MKAKGAVYLDDVTAIALYSDYEDVYQMLPSPLTGRHVMHATYDVEDDRRSIDLYVLDSKTNLTHMDCYHQFAYNDAKSAKINVDKIFKRQNVQITAVSDIRGSNQESHLLLIKALDLDNFCNNPASGAHHSTITYVDNIIPVTKIDYLHPAQLFSSGKADFAPGCHLLANADTALNCVTRFVPANSQAYFTGTHFVGFYENNPEGCVICYAASKQQFSYPKSFIYVDPKQLDKELAGDFTVFKSDKYLAYCDSLGKLTSHGKEYSVEERDFLLRGVDSQVVEQFSEKFGKRVDVLRLGKRTEVGAKYNRDMLKIILEGCAKSKAKPVIPTRFLEYDPSLEGFLKESQASSFHGVGLDPQEPWIKYYGFDTPWRMEQAARYRSAGVNANFYLLIEAVNGPTLENKQIIDFAQKYRIPIQLLPMRISGENLIQLLTGQSKKSLLQSVHQTALGDFTSGDFGCDGKVFGGYEPYGTSTVSPLRINQKWFDLMHDSNGMITLCHHNSEKIWCGGCGHYSAFERKMPELRIARMKRGKRHNTKEYSGKLFGSDNSKTE
jgi:hypothetical protein